MIFFIIFKLKFINVTTEAISVTGGVVDMQTHLSMALLPLLAVVVRPALSSPLILASGKQTVKLS